MVLSKKDIRHFYYILPNSHILQKPLIEPLIYVYIGGSLYTMVISMNKRKNKQ
jgi:hypothetical protein